MVSFASDCKVFVSPRTGVTFAYASAEDNVHWFMHGYYLSGHYRGGTMGVGWPCHGVCKGQDVVAWDVSRYILQNAEGLL